MLSSLDSVTLVLSTVAGTWLAGGLGEFLFQRTRVPDVLWLMMVGVGLGPVSGVIAPSDLAGAGPVLAVLSLVLVLFEAGTSFSFRNGKRASTGSLLGTLALAGTLCAVVLLCQAARWTQLLPGSWTWHSSLLLGVVVGAPSSLAAVPSLIQYRVRSKLVRRVSDESSITSALTIVLAFSLIEASVRTGGLPGLTALRSWGIGLALGAIVSLIWILVLRHLNTSERAYPISLGVLLLVCLAADSAGGSAPLCVFAVALGLGNAPLLAKLLGLKGDTQLGAPLRAFHGQVMFMVKAFLFVFMGASLAPQWRLLGLGALLGISFALVRWLAVFVAARDPVDARERVALGLCFPRGLSAGALALLASARGVGSDTLPVITCAGVFTSNLVFAAALRWQGARLEDLPEAPSAAQLPAGAARPALYPIAAMLRTGASLPRPARTGFETDITPHPGVPASEKEYP